MIREQVSQRFKTGTGHGEVDAIPENIAEVGAQPDHRQNPGAWQKGWS